MVCCADMALRTVLVNHASLKKKKINNVNITSVI
jgi:hypothetical protein